MTLLSALAPAGAWAADASCTMVASAQGPSVQEVVDVLAPGQVACVHGEVRGNVAIRRPGVTVTSEPGQRGRIAGQLKVMPGADRVTVTGLDLDGSPEPDKPSVGIYADDVALVGNDITNRNTEICVIVGYGGIAPERTRIERNRIHHCGELPVTNMDHGIYLESGVETVIVGNEIVDNADRGIQLYPWARRTTVEGNVIDGNGVGIIFGGLDGSSASDNVVRYNVIANSRIRHDVESWYPADTPPGTGNVVERNCVSGPGISTANGGFVARDNLVADPRYVDRARGDYRLAPGSACAEVLAAGREGRAWSPPPARAPERPASPSSDGVSIGVEQPSRDTVAVRVTLVDPRLDATPALVEVRFGNGTWRKVGRPKLKKGRAYVKRMRSPRRSTRVRVRASVLVRGRAASRRLARRSRRGAARRPFARRVFMRTTRLA